MVHVEIGFGPTAWPQVDVKVLISLFCEPDRLLTALEFFFAHEHTKLRKHPLGAQYRTMAREQPGPTEPFWAQHGAARRPGSRAYVCPRRRSAARRQTRRVGRLKDACAQTQAARVGRRADAGRGRARAARTSGRRRPHGLGSLGTACIGVIERHLRPGRRAVKSDLGGRRRRDRQDWFEDSGENYQKNSRCTRRWPAQLCE